MAIKRVKPVSYSYFGAIWFRMCMTFGSLKPSAQDLAALHQDEMNLSGLTGKQFTQRRRELAVKYKQICSTLAFSWTKTRIARKNSIATSDIKEKSNFELRSDKRIMSRLSALCLLDGFKLHSEKIEKAKITVNAIKKWRSSNMESHRNAVRMLKEQRRQSESRSKFFTMQGLWNKENGCPSGAALNAHTYAGLSKKTFKFSKYVSIIHTVENFFNSKGMANGQKPLSMSSRAVWTKVYAHITGKTLEEARSIHDQNYADAAAAKHASKKAWKKFLAEKEASMNAAVKSLKKKHEEEFEAFEIRRARFLENEKSNWEKRRTAYLKNSEDRKLRWIEGKNKYMAHKQAWEQRQEEIKKHINIVKARREFVIQRRLQKEGNHQQTLVLQPSEMVPKSGNRKCNIIPWYTSRVEKQVVVENKQQIPCKKEFVPLPIKDIVVKKFSKTIKCPVTSVEGKIVLDDRGENISFRPGGIHFHVCKNCYFKYECPRAMNEMIHQIIGDCPNCGIELLDKLKEIEDEENHDSGVESGQDSNSDSEGEKPKEIKNVKISVRNGEFGLFKNPTRKHCIVINNRIVLKGQSIAIPKEEYWHSHVCLFCKYEYEHQHPYSHVKHPQLPGDCPKCRPSKSELEILGRFGILPETRELSPKEISIDNSISNEFQLAITKEGNYYYGIIDGLLIVPEHVSGRRGGINDLPIVLKEKLSPIGKNVYIGKPDGQCCEVKPREFLQVIRKEKNLVHWFKPNTSLISGTPLYNDEGKLCSLVTSSDGKGNFSIADFIEMKGVGTEKIKSVLWHQTLATIADFDLTEVVDNGDYNYPVINNDWTNVNKDGWYLYPTSKSGFVVYIKDRKIFCIPQHCIKYINLYRMKYLNVDYTDLFDVCANAEFIFFTLPLNNIVIHGIKNHFYLKKGIVERNNDSYKMNVFYATNNYYSGEPIYNEDKQLVSVITYKNPDNKYIVTERLKSENGFFFCNIACANNGPKPKTPQPQKPPKIQPVSSKNIISKKVTSVVDTRFNNNGKKVREIKINTGETVIKNEPRKQSKKKNGNNGGKNKPNVSLLGLLVIFIFYFFTSVESSYVDFSNIEVESKVDCRWVQMFSGKFDHDVCDNLAQFDYCNILDRTAAKGECNIEDYGSIFHNIFKCKVYLLQGIEWDGENCLEIKDETDFIEGFSKDCKHEIISIEMSKFINCSRNIEKFYEDFVKIDTLNLKEYYLQEDFAKVNDFLQKYPISKFVYCKDHIKAVEDLKMEMEKINIEFSIIFEEKVQQMVNNLVQIQCYMQFIELYHLPKIPKRYNIPEYNCNLIQNKMLLFHYLDFEQLFKPRTESRNKRSTVIDSDALVSYSKIDPDDDSAIKNSGMILTRSAVSNGIYDPIHFCEKIPNQYIAVGEKGVPCNEGVMASPASSDVIENCTFGDTNIHSISKNGLIITRNEKKRCSYNSFDSTTMAYFMNMQPACSPCMWFFNNVLWEMMCFKNMLVPINDFRIYSDKLVMSWKNCSLKYDFKEFCGGQGPAKAGEDIFYADGYIQCGHSGQMVDGKQTLIQIIQEHFKKISEVTISTIVIILTIYLVKKPFYICLLLLSWFYFYSAFALCDVENQVLQVPTITKENSQTWYTLNVPLKEQTCFHIGNTTFKIKSIDNLIEYKSLGYMPTKIIPICSGFDWGCPGGNYNSLCDDTKCEQECKKSNGTFYEKCEINDDFYGDKCVTFASIRTYGFYCIAPPTTVDAIIYNRVQIMDRTKIRLEKQGAGPLENVVWDLSQDLSTMKLQIQKPVITYEIEPQVVIFYKKKLYCSNVVLDMSKICYSIKLGQPLYNENCLNVGFDWNVNKYDFELKFVTIGTLINNNFYLCPHQDAEQQGQGMLVNFKSVVGRLQIRSQEPVTENPQQMCESLSILNTTVSHGMVGYKKYSHVHFELSNLSPSECMIGFIVEQCTIIGNRYYMLDSKLAENVILTLICPWTTSELVKIQLAGNKFMEKKIEALNQNWQVSGSDVLDYTMSLYNTISENSFIKNLKNIFKTVSVKLSEFGIKNFFVQMVVYLVLALIFLHFVISINFFGMILVSVIAFFYNIMPTSALNYSEIVNDYIVIDNFLILSFVFILFVNSKSFYLFTLKAKLLLQVTLDYFLVTYWFTDFFSLYYFYENLFLIAYYFICILFFRLVILESYIFMIFIINFEICYFIYNIFNSKLDQFKSQNKNFFISWLANLTFYRVKNNIKTDNKAYNLTNHHKQMNQILGEQKDFVKNIFTGQEQITTYEFLQYCKENFSQFQKTINFKINGINACYIEELSIILTARHNLKYWFDDIQLDYFEDIVSFKCSSTMDPTDLTTHFSSIPIDGIYTKGSTDGTVTKVFHKGNSSTYGYDSGCVWIHETDDVQKYFLQTSVQFNKKVFWFYSDLTRSVPNELPKMNIGDFVLCEENGKSLYKYRDICPAFDVSKEHMFSKPCLNAIFPTFSLENTERVTVGQKEYQLELNRMIMYTRIENNFYFQYCKYFKTKDILFPGTPVSDSAIGSDIISYITNYGKNWRNDRCYGLIDNSAVMVYKFDSIFSFFCKISFENCEMSKYYMEIDYPAVDNNIYLNECSFIERINYIIPESDIPTEEEQDQIIKLNIPLEAKVNPMSKYKKNCFFGLKVVEGKISLLNFVQFVKNHTKSSTTNFEIQNVKYFYIESIDCFGISNKFLDTNDIVLGTYKTNDFTLVLLSEKMYLQKNVMTIPIEDLIFIKDREIIEYNITTNFPNISSLDDGQQVWVDDNQFFYQKSCLERWQMADFRPLFTNKVSLCKNNLVNMKINNSVYKAFNGICFAWHVQKIGRRQFSDISGHLYIPENTLKRLYIGNNEYDVEDDSVLFSENVHGGIKIQEVRYFRCKEWLKSGTPICDNEGRIYSVITASFYRNFKRYYYYVNNSPVYFYEQNDFKSIVKDFPGAYFPIMKTYHNEPEARNYYFFSKKEIQEFEADWNGEHYQEVVALKISEEFKINRELFMISSLTKFDIYSYNRLVIEHDFGKLLVEEDIDVSVFFPIIKASYKLLNILDHEFPITENLSDTNSIIFLKTQRDKIDFNMSPQLADKFSKLEYQELTEDCQFVELYNGRKIYIIDFTSFERFEGLIPENAAIWYYKLCMLNAYIDFSKTAIFCNAEQAAFFNYNRIPQNIILQYIIEYTENIDEMIDDYISERSTDGDDCLSNYDIYLTIKDHILSKINDNLLTPASILSDDSIYNIVYSNARVQLKTEFEIDLRNKFAVMVKKDFMYIYGSAHQVMSALKIIYNYLSERQVKYFAVILNKPELYPLIQEFNANFYQYNGMSILGNEVAPNKMVINFLARRNNVRTSFAEIPFLGRKVVMRSDVQIPHNMLFSLHNNDAVTNTYVTKWIPKNKTKISPVLNSNFGRISFSNPIQYGEPSKVISFLNDEIVLTGTIEDSVTIGSFFMIDNQLMTSYHVSRGNAINMVLTEYERRVQHSGDLVCTTTDKSLTLTFGKPTVSDKIRDLCLYNPCEVVDQFSFSKCNVGEVCFVVDFSKKSKLGLRVNNSTINKSGIVSYIYEPVQVNYEKSTVQPLYNFNGAPGFSGCPIFNSNLEICGIYGKLRYMHLNDQESKYDQPKWVAVSPIDVSDSTYDVYFEKCAHEFINRKANDMLGKQYNILLGATGSGKTCRFPLKIMDQLYERGIKSQKKILLLVPTRISVKTIFEFICKYVPADRLKSYRIEYTIGRQGDEEYYNHFGSGNIQLYIQTYGYFNARMINHPASTKYDFYLLDEIHNRRNEEVCLSEIMIVSKNVASEKVCYITATDTGFDNGIKLQKSNIVVKMRYHVEERIMKRFVTGEREDSNLIIDTSLLCFRDFHNSAKYMVPWCETLGGIIIIFVASHNDCNKLKADIVQRNPEKHVMVIYSGAKYDLSELTQTSIIVATEVISQSITLPGVSCVISLGYKCGFQTTGKFENNKLYYDSRFTQIPFSSQELEQQRGRTGRTCMGYFYTPLLDNKRMQNNYDFGTYTKVFMKLIRYVENVDKIFEVFDNCDIAAVKSIGATLNSMYLKSEDQHKNLAGVFKEIHNYNGDQFGLALDPWLTEEQLKEQSELPITNRRNISLALKQVLSTSKIILKTASQKSVITEQTGFEMYYDTALSGDFEYYDNVSVYSETDNVCEYVAIGAMAFGGLLTIGLCANSAIRNYGDKYVTSIGYTTKKQLKETIYACEQIMINKTVNKIHSELTALWQIVKKHLRKFWDMCRNKKQTKRKTLNVTPDTLGTNNNAFAGMTFETFKALMKAKYLMFYKYIVSLGLAGISVQAFSGLSLGGISLGLIYDKLEKILGQTIAFVLTGATMFLITNMFSISGAILTSISTLIGYIIMGLFKSDSHDIYGEKKSGAMQTTRLVTGLSLGVGLQSIIKLATQTPVSNSIVQSTFSQSGWIARGLMVQQMSRTSHGFLVGRRLYQLCKNITEGQQLGYGTFMACLDMGYHAALSGGPGAVVAITIALAGVGVRMMLKHNRVQTLINNQLATRSTESLGVVGNLLQSYDNLVDHIFNVSAFIIDPSSLLSVITVIIRDWIFGNEVNADTIKHNLDLYLGMPVFLTLIDTVYFIFNRLFNVNQNGEMNLNTQSNSSQDNGLFSSGLNIIEILRKAWLFFYSGIGKCYHTVAKMVCKALGLKDYETKTDILNQQRDMEMTEMNEASEFGQGNSNDKDDFFMSQLDPSKTEHQINTNIFAASLSEGESEKITVEADIHVSSDETNDMLCTKLVQSYLSKSKRFIVSVVDKIKEIFRKIINGIKSGLKTVGKYISEGMIEEIKKLFSWNKKVEIPLEPIINIDYNTKTKAYENCLNAGQIDLLTYLMFENADLKSETYGSFVVQKYPSLYWYSFEDYRSADCFKLTPNDLTKFIKYLTSGFGMDGDTCVIKIIMDKISFDIRFTSSWNKEQQLVKGSIKYSEKLEIDFVWIIIPNGDNSQHFFGIELAGDTILTGLKAIFQSFSTKLPVKKITHKEMFECENHLVKVWANNTNVKIGTAITSFFVNVAKDLSSFDFDSVVNVISDILNGTKKNYNFHLVHCNRDYYETVMHPQSGVKQGNFSPALSTPNSNYMLFPNLAHLNPVHGIRDAADYSIKIDKKTQYNINIGPYQYLETAKGIANVLKERGLNTKFCFTANNAMTKIRQLCDLQEIGCYYYKKTTSGVQCFHNIRSCRCAILVSPDFIRFYGCEKHLDWKHIISLETVSLTFDPLDEIESAQKNSSEIQTLFVGIQPHSFLWRFINESGSLIAKVSERTKYFFSDEINLPIEKPEDRFAIENTIEIAGKQLSLLMSKNQEINVQVNFPSVIGVRNPVLAQKREQWFTEHNSKDVVEIVPEIVDMQRLIEKVNQLVVKDQTRHERVHYAGRYKLPQKCFRNLPQDIKKHVTADAWNSYVDEFLSRDPEKQRAYIHELTATLKQKQYNQSLINRLTKTLMGTRGNIVASRAFYKAQQIDEVSPNIIESANVIYDPTMGSGGFAHYISTKYHNQNKRLYGSTLKQSRHRMPDMTTINAEGSNLQVINCMGDDDGDIRNPKMLDKYWKIAQGHPSDLMIFDIGEVKDNLYNENRFYLKTRRYKDCLHPKIHIVDEENSTNYSILQGMQFLINNCIKKGGKLILKMIGVTEELIDIVYPLITHFRQFKILKVATCPEMTREFYLICKGFDKNYQMNRKSVIVAISQWRKLQYEAMERAYTNYKHGCNIHNLPKVRHDWLTPKVRGQVYNVLIDDDRDIRLPKGFQIDLVLPDGENINKTWRPKWQDKITAFKQHLGGNHCRTCKQRQRKFTLDEEVMPDLKNVCPIGKLGMRARNVTKSHIECGLIKDCLYDVFSLDKDVGTYANVSEENEFVEMSKKRRLDVNPGMPQGDMMMKLAWTLKCMTTEYGHKLYDQVGFATKDEVLKLMNFQGATGMFDTVNSMKEYIEIHPNWYDDVLHNVVMKYENDNYHGDYTTVRVKKEATLRKDIDSDCKLMYTKENDLDEIQSGLKNPPRFIQFADARTRIGHIIIFGKLMLLAQKQKLYKGTINGLAPHLVGRVIKSLWDLCQPEQKRNIKFGFNKEFDMHIKTQIEQFGTPGYDAAALTLDFSKWDSTVTLFDRMVAANHNCRFYKEKCKNIVFNACKNLAYTVCVNDDGDVWARAGQRGSGEFFLTSFENTQLVAAHIYTSIAEVLGKDIKEMLETKLWVYMKIDGTEMPERITHKCDYDNIKVYEFPSIFSISDGDDTNIITTRDNAKMLCEGIEEGLTKMCKVIRSGNRTGATMVTHMEQLEFCSHTYSAVYIGKNARKTTDHRKSPWTICRENNFKMYYLPTRPTARILGKLPKTLKRNTQYHDMDNLSGTDIVRSKCMSYLLLYPHFRIVRILLLALLSILGNCGKLTKRWTTVESVDLTKEFTISGALYSLYGVKTFDDISTRDYREDRKDLSIIRYNVSLKGLSSPKTVMEVIRYTAKFLKGRKDVRNLDILRLDSSVGSRIIEFLTN